MLMDEPDLILLSLAAPAETDRVSLRKEAEVRENMNVVECWVMPERHSDQVFIKLTKQVSER